METTELTLTREELRVVRKALRRHWLMAPSMVEAETARALQKQIEQMEEDLGWRG